MRNYDLSNTIYAKSQIIKNKIKEALERKKKKYSITLSEEKKIIKKNQNFKKNINKNINLIGNSSSESIFKKLLRDESDIKEKEKKKMKSTKKK